MDDANRVTSECLYAGGKSVEDCVRFATAAGTAATLELGTELCHLSGVQQLLSKVKVEKIVMSKG